VPGLHLPLGEALIQQREDLRARGVQALHVSVRPGEAPSADSSSHLGIADDLVQRSAQVVAQALQGILVDAGGEGPEWTGDALRSPGLLNLPCSCLRLGAG